VPKITEVGQCFTVIQKIEVARFYWGTVVYCTHGDSMAAYVGETACIDRQTWRADCTAHGPKWSMNDLTCAVEFHFRSAWSTTDVYLNRSVCTQLVGYSWLEWMWLHAERLLGL